MMTSAAANLSRSNNPRIPLDLTVGDDLKLSILDASDTEEIFAVIDRNRTHLRKWLPWVDAVSTSEQEEVFILGSHVSFERNHKAVYGIRYQGQIIGVVGLPWIDWEQKECAMGYWLDESQTGHGFVTRCCKELLRICFEHLRLNRVILQVAVHNLKSRAVAKRMGMRLEGVMEDKWKALWRAEGCVGPYACDVQYGLTESEWRSSVANVLSKEHIGEVNMNAASTTCMIR